LPKEKGLDRLFVEAKVVDLFRDMTYQSTRNASIYSQPFKELKDAFLWAVSLGVRSESRRPLEGTKEGLLLWTYLSDDEKRSLAMIALAETGDIKVVADEGSIQEIAEEFANEGIRTIKREIHEGSGDPLWKLVDMVRSEQGE
jgi:dnd system-associated protein 4